MFLKCSYFFPNLSLDVLIDLVFNKNNACIRGAEIEETPFSTIAVDSYFFLVEHQNPSIVADVHESIINLELWSQKM